MDLSSGALPSGQFPPFLPRERRRSCHVHLRERGMDGRAADLDSNGGVESTHSGLKGFEPEVLVGEQTVLAAVDAEGNSDGNVVLIGAEPGVALCLLEDVMEERVVAVIIHGLRSSGARAQDYGAKTAPGMCARGRVWKKEIWLRRGGREDALGTTMGVKRTKAAGEGRRAGSC